MPPAIRSPPQVAGLIAVYCALTACGRAPSVPPTTGATPRSWDGPIGSTDAAEGRTVFDDRCASCHPDGNEDAGPALRGRQWPAGRVRRQVREGGLTMPAFQRARIDDRQLESLLAYLQTLGAVEGGSEAAATAATPGSRPRAGEQSSTAFGESMRRRVSLARVHRTLGIATWVSMTLTLVLGDIQYFNLYGLGADQSSNPCAEGSALFGQGQCSGTPWPHLGSAILTGTLYSSTLALSLAMPDPGGLSEGEGAAARTLRRHKLLRWVHLVGMVAQMTLGAFVANADRWFGVDRANDYATLQALATIHLGAGLVTWGAVTWAGALMLNR